MIEETPIDSKKEEPLKKLRHPFEFEEFVSWIALPDALRVPKTQADLAEEFGVGEDTLSEWKQRKGFWDLVRNKKNDWCRERTPNVILALYRKILKDGGASEIKLWLQYVECWDSTEKLPPQAVQEPEVKFEKTEEYLSTIKRIAEITTELRRRQELKDAGEDTETNNQ